MQGDKMLARLSEIVGPRGLVSEAADMRSWLTDWRGRKTGQALCVVLPASTEEVVGVMHLAAAAGQPIFPQGGNTGLCFGAVPDSGRADRPGIVLSLSRMNRIRDIDQASDLMTVDAGVILANVHAVANTVNRQFPLHLGSEGSAQIGGLISTNAGGTAVLRYGPMRDLVAGLEVVLADGRVLNDLGGLRKNNTGYPLRQLFVGAEGTLGVITGATLRLYPKPVRSASAWLALDTPEQAVALLTHFRELAGSHIEAFELLSASQVALVARHIARVRIPFEPIPAWSLMVELASSDSHTDLDALLQQALEQGAGAGLIADAVLATSKQQAADIWHVRHSLSEANKKAGIGIVHDISSRQPTLWRLRAIPKPKYRSSAIWAMATCITF